MPKSKTESVAPPRLSGGVPARIPDPPPVRKLPPHKRFWAWWLPKAGRIALKQNTILSWLAYYLGMSSVGLWMRKQDRLDRAVRPSGESAWHTRETEGSTDPRRARRPF
jgi:hypothetical protein